MNITYRIKYSNQKYWKPEKKEHMFYQEVMKQYNLGPNGGIVTSLNLFATKFDQET